MIFKSAFLSCLVLFLLILPASAESPEGRWVDFGPMNGVADCESSPTPHNPNNPNVNDSVEIVAVSDSGKGDYGIFQFRQGTWDWVNGWLGRYDLVGVRPQYTSIADQWDAAQALVYSIPGGGISHWSCGYRYGDGTGPRFVTYEQYKPEPIEGCLNWLREALGWETLYNPMSPYYVVDEQC